MDAWDIPMYPAATAARLVRLHVDRVRRWLIGYDYSYFAGPEGNTRTAHKGPVIKRDKSAESSYASFLDLIDLLFVKEFLHQGISLQKIRKALKEAEELINEHHFAQRRFFTEGKSIYLELKENNEGDALLELLSGGQWVFASIIKDLAHRIDFDQPTGFARRWYPLGREGLIVLDPGISFGKPTLIGRGVATANIYDMFLAERENVQHVCSWMDLKRPEVEAAVTFESQLAAA